MSRHGPCRMKCDTCGWKTHRVSSTEAPCTRCPGTLHHCVLLQGGQMLPRGQVRVQSSAWLRMDDQRKLARIARLNRKSLSRLIASIIETWLEGFADDPSETSLTVRAERMNGSAHA